MFNPILFLEINEVPWRIIQKYRKDFSHIEAFFSRSASYSTKTVDTGELSPWITWPTIHRGVSGAQHKIRHLGQDPKTYEGVPIWEEIRKRGANIGIFGSLQSWPPVDPGENGFYVPDTFAHDDSCIPNYLSPLQRFNLDQVADNGRVVEGKFWLFLNLKFFYSLFRSGIQWKTLARILKQLVLEKWDPAHKARRPIFQTILFWDAYRSLYKPSHPPYYSTFFTNHVASVMHRYWNHIFPEDFPEEFRPKQRNQESTMHFAMKILDEMLKDVLCWQEKNPKLTIFLASSMGQSSILRLEHTGYEFILKSTDQLLCALDIDPSGVKKLLAMAPQIALEIFNHEKRKKIINSLQSCQTISGAPLFLIDEVGNNLSITVINPKIAMDAKAEGFYGPTKSLLAWNNAGIQVIQIDPGTAYHVPEGIFAVYGYKQHEFMERQKSQTLMADELKSEILKTFDDTENKRANQEL